MKVRGDRFIEKEKMWEGGGEGGKEIERESPNNYNGCPA
jgi:hypothetical protein